MYVYDERSVTSEIEWGLSALGSFALMYLIQPYSSRSFSTSTLRVHLVNQLLNPILHLSINIMASTSSSAAFYTTFQSLRSGKCHLYSLQSRGMTNEQRSTKHWIRGIWQKLANSSLTSRPNSEGMSSTSQHTMRDLMILYYNSL